MDFRKPDTPKDAYLQYLAGNKDIVLPEPKTDKDLALYKMCVNGVSWNDLTDKPFGDNEDGTVYQMSGKYVEGMGYVESDKHTVNGAWDENGNNLTVDCDGSSLTVGFDDGTLAGEDFIRIADSIPSESFKTMVFRGENYKGVKTEWIVADMWDEFVGEGVVNNSIEYLYHVVNVHEDNATAYELSFPKAGLYVSTYFVKFVMEWQNETIHPIDQKYIVLTSPNGTKYNLSVADDGTLSAVAT